MIEQSRLVLKRREIADYADTIRTMREHGADPHTIAEAEKDLAYMRVQLAREMQ